ncbi:outer membrane protein transport protein [Yoonia litorea]|uniref:Long-chain fatty acid transport protein n=1 Tax=Yoonia litorea TaxID=1123755 RepID=A0A1I6M2D2_9RHOB|nr:outer membrane protein transport protein [Yoonia litorea]SFS09794.1 Long-chain fatty acid transport protein [Yoonia litorea]
MKNVLTAGAALLLTTSIATAGGLDRSGQGVGILWEDGDVIQLSFGGASPTVSGTAIPLLGGFDSEDMSPSYFNLGFGYKNELSDTTSIAVIIDQPFGGDVDYPVGTNYFAQGATASVDSFAVTGLVKYQLNENASVYGGLRYQSIKSAVEIPAGPYELETESTTGTGYVVGAAYEIPEIAFRVALTYNSAIDHEQETLENGVLATTTSFSSPQSVNLDFQSGVAEDTLVFGTIRWAEWSSFAFTPAGYAGANAGASLLSYDDDTVTYTLGVGRRFSDVFSGFATVGYEAATGGYSGNLGPTDGFTSVGLGGTYQVQENLKLTGGITYVMIGDAVVENPLAPDTDGAFFEDNSAIGAGLRVTYSF